MATDTKRTHDKAAEAFCDHVLECPVCTMHGPHCDEGDALLLVENEAWNAYRASQGD